MAKEATRNGVILVSFLGTVILLLVAIASLKSYFTVTSNREVERKVLAADNPALLQLRARERDVLEGYGWVDRGKGIVRIPVERAMDLLVEEARRAGGGKAGGG